MKIDFTEALRSRQSERESQMYLEMARFLSTADPAVRIVGGEGGFIEVSLAISSVQS
jgi:hypothetical protein